MAQQSNRKSDFRNIRAGMIVCQLYRDLGRPETLTSEIQIDRSEET